MQHRIPIDDLRPRVGPQIEEMARAVGACVHCGFCLPTCPTYRLLGEEMDSPRGRILLMKGVLEGELELEEVLPHIDPCLGCEACVTACPSGVAYGELLAPFRAFAESERRRSPHRRLARRLLLATLTSPRRLRALARLGIAVRPLLRAGLGALLPAPLRTPLELLPARLPRRDPLPERSPAQGVRRARVALLAGCAQQVLRPGINRATIQVLNRCGVEVLVPGGQGCCGSLALHAGEAERARRLARRNLAAFDRAEVDAVLTNAAGCGSGIGAYPHLFKGEPDETEAGRLSGEVWDASRFLAELGPPAASLPRPTVVAYQDPCHLAHAQRERGAPRRLLEAIHNLTLVEPEEWELCCGSAGIYNLEQPELAARLGERKARCLLATGASVVASGNIGCITQLEHHLRRLGEERPVLHVMELLASALANGHPAAT